MRLTGRLYDLGTLNVLRFQRVLPHSAERVWSAVATATGLEPWFPATVDWDYRVGGSMHFTFQGDHGPPAPPGTITVIQRPRVFSFNWGGELLRFTIAPDNADATRCTLDFSHTFAKPDPAKIAAGWEVCFDLLEHSLSGQQEPTGGQDYWLALYRVYTDRFAG